MYCTVCGSRRDATGPCPACGTPAATAAAPSPGGVRSTLGTHRGVLPGTAPATAGQGYVPPPEAPGVPAVPVVVPTVPVVPLAYGVPVAPAPSTAAPVTPVASPLTGPALGAVTLAALLSSLAAASYLTPWFDSSSFSGGKPTLADDPSGWVMVGAGVLAAVALIELFRGRRYALGLAAGATLGLTTVTSIAFDPRFDEVPRELETGAYATTLAVVVAAAAAGWCLTDRSDGRRVPTWARIGVAAGAIAFATGFLGGMQQSGYVDLPDLLRGPMVQWTIAPAALAVVAVVVHRGLPGLALGAGLCLGLGAIWAESASWFDPGYRFLVGAGSLGGAAVAGVGLLRARAADDEPAGELPWLGAIVLLAVLVVFGIGVDHQAVSGF